MKTGRYKIGDEVLITKLGVHNREVGIVRDVTHVAAKLTMAGKPWFIYTVETIDWGVISGGKDTLLLTLEEGDIAPYKLIKDDEVVCECGGMYLTIEHHLPYCPKYKGGSNDQSEEHTDRKRQIN